MKHKKTKAHPVNEQLAEAARLVESARAILAEVSDLCEYSHPTAYAVITGPRGTLDSLYVASQVLEDLAKIKPRF